MNKENIVKYAIVGLFGIGIFELIRASKGSAITPPSQSTGIIEVELLNSFPTSDKRVDSFDVTVLIDDGKLASKTVTLTREPLKVTFSNIPYGYHYVQIKSIGCSFPRKKLVNVTPTFGVTRVSFYPGKWNAGNLHLTGGCTAPPTWITTKLTNGKETKLVPHKITAIIDEGTYGKQYYYCKDATGHYSQIDTIFGYLVEGMHMLELYCDDNKLIKRYPFKIDKGQTTTLNINISSCE